MFKNKSAWFSSSVPQTCRDFWMLEGGAVVGWRTADYLFSADASCPDTMRIFESRDYLWSEVVVFHSLFLSTCEKRKSVKSVCIGHYVLPPASVQHEVRVVVGRLIWECEEEQAVAQTCAHDTEDEYSEGEGNDVSKSNPDSSPTESSVSQMPPWVHVHDYPVSDKLTGYVNMDNLQKYTGDLCDFRPACSRCRNSGHEQMGRKRKAC